ncbi:hypothetical protein D3C75_992110 [compost metagenome]
MERLHFEGSWVLQGGDTESWIAHHQIHFGQGQMASQTIQGIVDRNMRFRGNQDARARLASQGLENDLNDRGCLTGTRWPL